MALLFFRGLVLVVLPGFVRLSFARRGIIGIGIGRQRSNGVDDPLSPVSRLIMFKKVVAAYIERNRNGLVSLLL